MHRRLCTSCLILGCVALPSASWAQSGAAAANEAAKLYQDAAKDMEKGQFSPACPKLEAARKILPEHVRTAMTLALCYEKIDKPADALELLEATKPLAVDQKSTDKVNEIEGRIKELKTRVPKLVVVVPDGIAATPGMSIARNGVPIVASKWGTELAVNPGSYEIEVTALNKEPWKTSATAKVGATERVEIAPPWQSEPADAPVEPRTPMSGLRIAGFAGIGLGAVGMGIGAVLGGLALSKNAESKDGHCNASNVCDDVGKELRRDAITFGNGSTAAFVVGGVLATAGVVLVVMGKPKEAGAQTSVWVGPSSVGLRGQW
ncbi:MAG: hypothetical protein IPM54_43910 [Polyangiaceae bacterium]|nr:hypothetical protein [Polyangiaceae bacterium]